MAASPPFLLASAPHGNFLLDKDAPRTPPRCLEGPEKLLNDKFYNPKQYLFYKICYKLSPWLCWCWGSPWGWGDGPRTPPRCLEGVRIKFLMAIITMPNNISSLKYALISVPVLADVGVPYGVGDGSRAPPWCPEGSGKSSKWQILLCLTIVVLWNML